MGKDYERICFMRGCLRQTRKRIERSRIVEVMRM